MNIAGIGIDSAFNFAQGIIDRVWPKAATMEEKAQAIAAIAPLIEDRDDTVVNAQKEIIVAEMNQSDTYTKRARPSVIYAGLLFIGLVYVVIPSIIKAILAISIATKAPGELATTKAVIAELAGLTRLELPTEFWVAWGSVVSIWSIGRSVEKKGMANKLVSMITGNK